MKGRKLTAGERMIASARQALAFAEGKEDHGCEAHVPDDIDVIAREPDAVRRALPA